MTAIYDMDPSTSTIATAWSSSGLGDPETGPTEIWEALEADEAAARKPASITRHAGFVAALVGAFGIGAAFGLAVFDFASWTPQTITLRYVSTQETPGAIEVAPSVAVSAPGSLPKSVAAAPPNVVSPTPNASAPESVLAAAAPTVADQPEPVTQPGPVIVVSPPTNAPGGGKMTVDIAIPAPPDAVPVPDEPDPEPEDPTPEPTLQLAPETDSTTLQPQQPPTLKKPRTALYDPFTPGSKREAISSLKPSQRTTLANP